jgi:hypothetical protein
MQLKREEASTQGSLAVVRGAAPVPCEDAVSCADLKPPGLAYEDARVRPGCMYPGLAGETWASSKC